MADYLSKIEAIPGDCCTRPELRKALDIPSDAVLELPPADTRTTDEPAWSKPLIRRWLNGTYRASRHISERVIR